MLPTELEAEQPHAGERFLVARAVRIPKASQPVIIMAVKVSNGIFNRTVRDRCSVQLR